MLTGLICWVALCEESALQGDEVPVVRAYTFEVQPTAASRNGFQSRSLLGVETSQSARCNADSGLSPTYNTLGEQGQRSFSLWIHSEIRTVQCCHPSKEPLSPQSLCVSGCRPRVGDSVEYIFGTE